MISIIVPFKEGPHFLTDCLECLKLQTYKDFEVILVYNDKEEDVTDIVNNYKDCLDIHEYTCEKSGVSAARNMGIANSNGDMCYFLDADDYIFPDALAHYAEAAAKNDVDYFFGQKTTSYLSRTVFFAINNDYCDTEALNMYNLKRKSYKINFRAEFPEGTDPSTLSDEDAEKYHKNMAMGLLLATRRSVKNISVLHTLIKKSVIEKYKLTFDEDELFFGDLNFVTALLEATQNCRYVPDAYYVKRLHNDPEHYPALVQQQKDEKQAMLNAVYEKTMKKLDPKGDVAFYLTDVYANYYVYQYNKRMRKNKNDNYLGDNFKEMHRIAVTFPDRFVKSLKGYRKRSLKILRKGNEKKALHFINRHLAVKKLKKIINDPKKFNTYLYTNYFIKLPMKNNYVILESFRGKAYSDSPKYIYEYLAKTYPGKYKFIWVLDNRRTKLPYGGAKVKRFGLRYAYYLAVSKYVVLNVRQPGWFIKREGNVFLDTWHGTPLKRLVFDQEEVTSASPLYKHQFFVQSRLWDYLISPNNFSTDTFERAFMFEREKIVTCGYPRNDILYTHNNPESISSIKKKLGIPEDKILILYAPTWRDDEYYDKGKYKFTLKLDLNQMKEKLGDKYAVVLRTHYYIADHIDTTGLEGFVYNESDYDDISELYLISDILITDYSSVFFDFANLRRPMLFYTYDLEKYRDMLRGFYLDIEKEVPGPLLFTTDEVIDAIDNIDSLTEKYAERYDEFYDRFCHIEDGHASERICELVFNGKQF
ncbi:MAG: bifunctional glycosyltransferase family 2 protein/CDP-glycerol:glycerophosphate glycerophosphotransferase [Lachnospiraceae bacterium]|nr:bifunctional glycosyltransferase family 2 protein/CDP-glycerol:glycerophosphate glycerophosphotransferase [Lachnospiraceae bacterium]